MRRTALQNKGVTLVEVMVSLVILLLVFMALIQTALISIEANTKNLARDTAVSVAEERMNDSRGEDFDTVITDAAAPTGAVCPTIFAAGRTHNKIIRNIRQDFCSNRTVTDIDANNKQVTVTVSWIWREETLSHSATTVIRRSL